MFPLAPLLFLLPLADAPTASIDEIEWEEFIGDDSVKEWVMPKRATTAVKDGCVNLSTASKGEELKLDRTLGDYEFSY